MARVTYWSLIVTFMDITYIMSIDRYTPVPQGVTKIWIEDIFYVNSELTVVQMNQAS